MLLIGALLRWNYQKPRLVEFTLLQLLQHNVQLGVAVKFSLLSSHWFIFGARQIFTIINLSQTVLYFRYFLDVVRYSVKGRGHVLFVNERRYSHSVVADVALSVGEAYAMGRWVGGSITNFKRIWVMYAYRLKHRDPRSLSKFKLNLKNFLKGFTFLRGLPSAIFFNSVKHSYWATGESYAMRIPSGGVTDTDALPDSVMYPIPGNDDAFGSVFFFNKLIAKVVLISKMRRTISVYGKFLDGQFKRRVKLTARRAARRRRRRRFFRKFWLRSLRKRAIQLRKFSDPLRYRLNHRRACRRIRLMRKYRVLKMRRLLHWRCNAKIVRLTQLGARLLEHFYSRRRGKSERARFMKTFDSR